jgi:hypothetical protein
MSRHPQKSNSHGSLKNLQVAINEKTKYLDCKISKVIGKQMNIDWKSPLKADDYAEYRDKDFLMRLGISVNKMKYPLSDFWPGNDPQWDALGVSDDEIILVEAKANIPEMVSPGTGAKNPLKAHLLFIYFINDLSVNGPKTKDEWLGAIQTMECYLGLAKNYKLRKYIHDIFIDVNGLR